MIDYDKSEASMGAPSKYRSEQTRMNKGMGFRDVSDKANTPACPTKMVGAKTRGAADASIKGLK